MKQSKVDFFLSLSIYGVGLLALLVADLYVARYFDDAFIADYAFIKSSIMIVSAICLMGYDTLFIRDQSLIKRYFSRFWKQTLVVSVVAVTFIAVVKNQNFMQAVLFLLAIIGLAFLNYISASSRACYNLWKAQFSINFWKIFLLLFLVLNYFNTAIEYYVLSVVIGVVLSYFLKGYYPNTKELTIEDKQIPMSEANKMGKYFLLTNLTLIFASNGEQFVINIYGDVDTSTHLFTYFAIFTPIALSLNGFLGFYFGPRIKRLANFNISYYINFTKKIFALSVFITLISIVVGSIYMIKFMEISLFEIDLVLVIVLSLLCIVRGVYVSTSIGLGIFGSKSSLAKSALLFWVITIAYIVSVVLMLILLDSKYVALGIAIASLLNWIGRLLVSNYFTLKELKITENNVQK